jgi:P2-related tail formation protein
MGDFTSDLVDPRTADVAWLPWLSQLVSVSYDRNLSEAQQRQAIVDASAGWRAGTTAAIAAAARLELTGTKSVTVYDHSISVPGDGTMWDILVITLRTETPNFDRMVATIERLGVAPAGCTIHAQGFTATWNVLERARPTWAQWDGSTWTQIEQTTI